MKPILQAFLDHPIDYAGLFPPAQLSMVDAVKEYSDVVNGPHQWIVDKFICPASRAKEFLETLPASSRLVSLTLIGTVPNEDIKTVVESDASYLSALHHSERVLIKGYEVRLTSAENWMSHVAQVSKLPQLPGAEEMDIFFELGWNEDFIERMHEITDANPEAGFKARTGGLTKEHFPAPELLAKFISECVALQVPVKFTAGLHEPLRNFDASIGTHRYGFLNVMLATGLAVIYDLSRREIQEILEIENPNEITVTQDSIEVRNYRLTHEDCNTLFEIFKGFGSCSVQEPIDGLIKTSFLSPNTL